MNNLEVFGVVLLVPVIAIVSGVIYYTIRETITYVIRKFITWLGV
jgi:hypothetical protein